MKNIVILMLSMFSTFCTYAQWVNNDVEMKLEDDGLLYINADYIHEAGEIDNKGTIVVMNNWFNNSSGNVFFSNADGIVEFEGIDQVIGGNTLTRFGTLSLSGKGIKQLQNHQLVTGNLLLQDAELATHNYILHLTNPASSSLSYNTGFITAAQNGGLRRKMTLSTDYIYPVGVRNGTDAYYRPVVIKPNGATDNTYTVALLSDINNLVPLNSAKKEDGIQAVHDRFYFKLKRDEGIASTNIDFVYNPGGDGNYNTMLSWDEQAQKLIKISTTPNQDMSNLTSTFGQKLSLIQWNNFNNTYYAIGRLDQIINKNDAVYNVLTSNGDGLNDSWVIPAVDNNSDNLLVIYNRWGTEVYRKQNYSNSTPFDQGDKLNPGTYYYILTLNPNSPNKEIKKGYLTIIK